MRGPSKESKMKDLLGLPPFRMRDTHVSSRHDSCLLRCVCKNLRVADVEVVFVICAEDWCDEGTLSRMATNFICFGHEPMCGDGQTDGAREGTDKNGSISIVKFGKWLSPEDRGALRLGKRSWGHTDMPFGGGRTCHSDKGRGDPANRK